MTILSLGFTPLEQCIQCFREGNTNDCEKHLIKVDEIGNSLLHSWGSIKHLGLIKNCPIADSILFDSSEFSHEEKIMGYLIYGDCFLKQEGQKASMAFKNYFEAYKISKATDNNILKAEPLKSIIWYLLFTNEDFELQRQFIEEHRLNAYDSLEIATNDYFKLRYEMNVAYKSGNVLSTFISGWSNLIETCISNDYKRLLIEVYSLYAVYLKVHQNNFIKAIQYYTLAFESAKEFTDVYDNIKFTSIANIAHIRMEQNRFSEAIKQLKSVPIEIVVSQKLGNQKLYYEWVSDCHLQLNQLDSAYLYLKRAQRKAVESSTLQHTSEIKEIDNKYRNDELKGLLERESLQRKINKYFAIGLGASILLLVSYFILIIYLNKQKQRLEEERLQKKIQETELRELKSLHHERSRIASEMHDDLGSGLTSIRYLSDKAISQAKDPQENIHLQKIATYSNNLLRNMGEIIWALNTRFDNSGNLMAYIRRYTSEYLEEHNIELKVEDVAGHSNTVISGEKRRNVFLAVKEALHNTVKYSGAEAVIIRFERSEQHLKIVLEEIGGKGFDVAQASENGNGIYNMKKRMTEIGSIDFVRNEQGMRLEILVQIN